MVDAEAWASIAVCIFYPILLMFQYLFGYFAEEQAKVVRNWYIALTILITAGFLFVGYKSIQWLKAIYENDDVKKMLKLIYLRHDQQKVLHDSKKISSGYTKKTSDPITVPTNETISRGSSIVVDPRTFEKQQGACAMMFVSSLITYLCFPSIIIYKPLPFDLLSNKNGDLEAPTVGTIGFINVGLALSLTSCGIFISQKCNKVSVSLMEDKTKGIAIIVI